MPRPPEGSDSAERSGHQRPGRAATILVAVLLAAVAYGGWNFYRRQMLFEFRVRIKDARGLSIGSPVRVAGIEAGSVRSIAFGDAPSDPGRLLPILTITVDRRMAGAIRTDLVAEVDRALVVGKTAIEITPGTGMGRPLAEGEMVDLAPYRAEKSLLENAKEGIENFFAPDPSQPPGRAPAQPQRQVSP